MIDSFHERFLIWNSVPTVNGQAPDLVLGQSDFTRNTPNDDNQDGTLDSQAAARVMHYPSGVFFFQDKLLVADTNNNRELIFQSQ